VDSPELTVQRWRNQGLYPIIENLYESVVFLGEQWLFDAVDNYRLQAVKERVFHLGFLGSLLSSQACSPLPVAAENPKVLVTAGGGYDGQIIVDGVCRLLMNSSHHNGSLSVTIVLGAHSRLVQNELEYSLHKAHVRAKVIKHIPDLTAEIDSADVVISMCGYNSIFELIQSQKKIIAVPRTHSGYEQLIRVNLLREIYDGLWIIPQNEFSPERLLCSLTDALSAPSPRKRLPMNGGPNLLKHLSIANSTSSIESNGPTLS
jgi:predicted glycosyltransferase